MSFESEYPGGLSDVVKECPEWIKLGCGDKEYICPEKNANFPAEGAPPLPDLKEHNNLCAEYLRDHPEVYEKLKDKKTAMGVTLAKCIKTGIDNKGHPHIKTVGLVAGDEECFVTFKELFDPVCSARHNNRDMTKPHVSDMDASKLSDKPIDPTGKYVLTTRCRTGRSVHGFPLPPSNSFEQRRGIEKALVAGLMKLEGELKGDYYGLYGSKSMADKAMSKEKEEELRGNGNLFQEPDSTLLLSSGCGRHWPDARGIFHNEAKNFFVWVNEEDHSRIISMQKGADVKAIFNRFALACKVIEETMKEMKNDAGEPLSFMHDDNHGYILTCPSNLGTGLRAGAMTKVPLFSKRESFKSDLHKMKLQARGTAGVDSASDGQGTFDISNADRLGYSEVVLCNLFIEGLSRVIEWEAKIEGGATADAITAEVDAYVNDVLPKIQAGEKV